MVQIIMFCVKHERTYNLTQYFITYLLQIGHRAIKKQVFTGPQHTDRVVGTFTMHFSFQVLRCVACRCLHQLQQRAWCYFHLVSLCACVSGQNVAETTTEVVIRTLPGVYMCPCLSVDRFCHHNSVTTTQDAVMKLWRCVVVVVDL